jgi:hypothetical protein
MATAGGPASIITQVQQGGPPINTLGGARKFEMSVSGRKTDLENRCRRR